VSAAESLEPIGFFPVVAATNEFRLELLRSCIKSVACHHGTAGEPESREAPRSSICGSIQNAAVAEYL